MFHRTETTSIRKQEDQENQESSDKRQVPGVKWVTSYLGRVCRVGRVPGKGRVFDMQEVIEGEHACG